MSQQESTITTSATPFSLGEALFGFYGRSMVVFLRPSPASFAEEAGNSYHGEPPGGYFEVQAQIASIMNGQHNIA